MRLLLISPYSDIASIGLRTVAAVMRDAGYPVTMLFLPHTPAEEARIRPDRWSYPPEVLDGLEELSTQADLVGVTVMTSYLQRARILSRAVRRRRSIPVVWGGIHPTVRPGDATGFADYVVIGEGEDAFLELVQTLEAGGDPTGLANLAVLRQDGVHARAPRPLLQDLSRLPYPEYGPEDHFVWDREAGGVVPMNAGLLRKHLAHGPISRIRGEVTYQLMATRGCPHRCAYCCNDVLQRLYQGQRHLRRRRDEDVLGEIHAALERYPFIQALGFSDDSFFVASDAEIEAFAERYAREVGLPFYCLGSPQTITERKLDALLDAGMYGLQMGIQTGSPAIQELYNRRISNRQVLQAAHLLATRTDRMVPPTYDFIIDSPWESEKEQKETLDLVRQLPRPYRLQLFSLVLFPGTALHQRAEREGLLGDEDEVYAKEYHARQATYANLVLGLYRTRLPKPLLELLSHPWVVRALQRPLLAPLVSGTYRLARWLKQRLEPRLRGAHEADDRDRPVVG